MKTSKPKKLTVDEEEVLAAYRDLRDDPDLDQPFIDDVQVEFDLPKDRTLTMTISNPNEGPTETDDDDRDPRTGDE